jgi:hypothetical protein
MSAFEDLARPTAMRQASDRVFGLVMTAACTVVALWPLLHGGSLRRALLFAGVLLLITSLLAPSLLRPFNRIWTLLGRALHAVVSPIVLAVVFYVVVVPTGFVLRLCGKRLLQIEADRGVPTYWLRREPAGPAPETMRNQF